MAGVAEGEVGAKLQALLTTAAVPATVPSIETVTASPLTPVPTMAGSAVVVSVLPLAGLAMVGAAGDVVPVELSCTRAAAVCHQLLATYWLETQKLLGVLGSTIAVELCPQGWRPGTPELK